MTLLTFSFTGENTTGTATFTIAQEYKFKNLWLKDVKYNIRNEILQNDVAKGTAADGNTTITPFITSALGVKMDFLDSKDCVLYSLADGLNAMGGQALNSAINITGLIPIGHAGTTDASLPTESDYSTQSHSYPYHLINNRPQTWAVGKTVAFSLYFRNVETDGVIQDWELMSGTTDAFSDICDIDITLQLE